VVDEVVLVAILHLVLSVKKISWAAAIATCLALTGHVVHGAVPKDKVLAPDERLAILRRAQVWTPRKVSALDLKLGPQGAGALKPGETVTCRYVDEKFRGATPKFGCTTNGHDTFKVKYGRDNGEVYAGVAATRLLWALGFGADVLYPVHVVCEKCPSSLPRNDGVAVDHAIRFEFAAIERKMPGHEIETAEGPGWSWPELNLVDHDAGGAPGAQRDALKLLAVFLQHTDNKREQQRLICRGGGGKGNECAEPFLLVHDVGKTFGGPSRFNRGSVGSVNLAEWTAAPVWADAKRCIGFLPPSQTGTLTNPEISEAGRKFLSDLLAQLSDRQLTDLFTVARFAEKPIPGTAAPTVQMWVSAFKEKRDEIANAHCPF
jgi:hypothetical protein